MDCQFPPVQTLWSTSGESSGSQPHRTGWRLLLPAVPLPTLLEVPEASTHGEHAQQGEMETMDVPGLSDEHADTACVVQHSPSRRYAEHRGLCGARGLGHEACNLQRRSFVLLTFRHDLHA
jgi:hypothetical protein